MNHSLFSPLVTKLNSLFSSLPIVRCFMACTNASLSFQKRIAQCQQPLTFKAIKTNTSYRWRQDQTHPSHSKQNHFPNSPLRGGDGRFRSMFHRYAFGSHPPSLEGRPKTRVYCKDSGWVKPPTPNYESLFYYLFLLYLLAPFSWLLSRFSNLLKLHWNFSVK